MNVEVLQRSDIRLGRHKVHDPRSRMFGLPERRATASVLHERHAPIWDQGKVGSCTANAALGCLAATPLWRPGDPAWTEHDAQDLYSQETKLDDRDIPGHWPPHDTGSSGLWSAKALRARGLISSYQHAFSTSAALAALQVQPISIGVPWLQSMFTPDQHGLVTVDPASGVAGGHQVCLDGIDLDAGLVRFAQSWGPGWGDHGWGWLRFRELDWLLRAGGDATAFTR